MTAGHKSSAFDGATENHYAIVGPILVSQGFSAIPCRPGTKVPGVYLGDKWGNHVDWTRYAKRLPTQIELDTWVNWPGAGVCIVLGGEHDLVAVDIDTTDHEVIAAVESILPQSPVQKVGSRGYSSFYRGPSVKDTKYKINGKNAVEILARGRENVVPPSIHPDTGRPYVWVGDALDRHTPDSLPMLPDDIVERLAEVLKPFGYEPEPERVYVEHASSGDDEWGETNAAALQRLDEWVPHLGIGARRKGASWRGNARKDGDSFALSFHPDGIKDFVTDEGFSPIDIVAKVAGVAPYEAMRMLRERLGLKDPPLLKFIFQRSPDDYSWSEPVMCERVHPNDPVMAAAAAIARVEAGDEAWAAHSEDAIELAGGNLQVARDHGLGSSEGLVASWMMLEIRSAQQLAERRLKMGRPAQPAEAEAPQSKSEERSERADGGKTREPMFKRVGELKAKPREWLIKGFLARNEVGNPFGRPDSFKGVSAAQLCVHIAGGVPFLGMEVKQMPAAYFAAERGEQAKRRIKGHIQRLGLPEDLPCYFGDRPVNLLDDADVKFLLEEITAMERDAGGPLGFLVIDTQSRTLDGDENSTKDGAKYAKAIELIRRRARAASLWIIAHSGHAEDAQDRPRGNSSLLGAYDTFYKHWKKDETHGLIKITIDRDGLGQKVFFFTVGLYDTCATNEDGEPVVIPFIELDKGEDKPFPFTFREPGDDTRPAKTTDGEKEALRALTRAVQDHGLVTPEGDGIYASEGDEDIPPGEVTVSTEAWRTTFYRLDRERSPDAGRKAFDRALGGLVKKGLVGKYSDRFWPK